MAATTTTASFKLLARQALKRGAAFTPSISRPPAAEEDCVEGFVQPSIATQVFRQTQANALQQRSLRVTATGLLEHVSPDVLKYAQAVMRHDLGADSSVYRTGDFFLHAGTHAAVPLDAEGLARLRWHSTVPISCYQPGDRYLVSNASGDYQTSIEVTRSQAYRVWQSYLACVSSSSSASLPSVGTVGGVEGSDSFPSSTLTLDPTPPLDTRLTGLKWCCGVEVCGCEDPYDYRYESQTDKWKTALAQ